jgi:hypothetical protein
MKSEKGFFIMVNRKSAFFYLLFSLITVCLGLWARSLTPYNLTNFPIDYGNYIQGIQALYRGENPYQNILYRTKINSG